MTFIDAVTSHISVHKLRLKSEVRQSFQHSKKHFENEFGSEVKCLSTDDRRECLSRKVKKFCLGSRTVYIATDPYSTRSKDTTKRIQKNTLGIVRTMPSKAKLDKRL